VTGVTLNEAGCNDEDAEILHSACLTA